MSIKLYVNYLVKEELGKLLGKRTSNPKVEEKSWGAHIEEVGRKLKIYAQLNKTTITSEDVKLIYLNQVVRLLGEELKKEQKDEQLYQYCQNIWRNYELFSSGIRQECFSGEQKDYIDNKVDDLRKTLEVYYSFCKEHDASWKGRAPNNLLDMDFTHASDSAVIIIKQKMLAYILDNRLSYCHEKSLSEVLMENLGHVFGKALSQFTSFFSQSPSEVPSPQAIAQNKFKQAINTIDHVVKAFEDANVLDDQGCEDKTSVITLNILVQVLAKELALAESLQGPSIKTQRLLVQLKEAIDQISKISSYMTVNTAMLEDTYRRMQDALLSQPSVASVSPNRQPITPAKSLSVDKTDISGGVKCADPSQSSEGGTSAESTVKSEKPSKSSSKTPKKKGGQS